MPADNRHSHKKRSIITERFRDISYFPTYSGISRLRKTREIRAVGGVRVFHISLMSRLVDIPRNRVIFCPEIYEKVFSNIYLKIVLKFS